MLDRASGEDRPLEEVKNSIIELLSRPRTVG
jgi:hypothetical protein